MIIKEFYKTRKDGVNLYKTYSDANVLIQKEGTNEFYAQAIDIENAPFTYIETDKPIPEKPANFRMRKPTEVNNNGEQNN